MVKPEVFSKLRTASKWSNHQRTIVSNPTNSFEAGIEGKTTRIKVSYFSSRQPPATRYGFSQKLFG